MRIQNFAFFVLYVIFLTSSGSILAQNEGVLTGAEQMEIYLPMLQGKRVGMIVNQTSVVRDKVSGLYVALPDTLLKLGVDIKCIMAPEHGYKGTAEAGAHIQNGHDKETGLTIYSLYGNDKKPRVEWLNGLDILIFDIQDVGCRFYTYLSTLYYVMQACGEQHKELIVLDRPNPNDTIDGPMLRPGYESFVGMIPVPILHGCTLGELALMMTGEKWLNEKQQPGKEAPVDRATIIPCAGWRHGQAYSLPIPPSKNLRNDHAIALYPSLCLFEGSDVSVGRGTDHPFEMFGSHDLRNTEAPHGFGLQFYLQHQREKGWGWITRPKFFNLLAGSNELYNQFHAGKDETAIRATWQKDLDAYRKLREPYLMY